MYSERTFCQFFLRRDTRKFTVIWMFANCTHSPIRADRGDNRDQGGQLLLKVMSRRARAPPHPAWNRGRRWGAPSYRLVLIGVYPSSRREYFHSPWYSPGLPRETRESTLTFTASGGAHCGARGQSARIAGDAVDDARTRFPNTGRIAGTRVGSRTRGPYGYTRRAAD